MGLSSLVGLKSSSDLKEMLLANLEKNSASNFIHYQIGENSCPSNSSEGPNTFSNPIFASLKGKKKLNFGVFLRINEISQCYSLNNCQFGKIKCVFQMKNIRDK